MSCCNPVLTLTASAVLAALAGGAFAEPEIPCRTARFVVPYGAGGGSDLQARVIADAYNRLGYEPQLQVINITGQGGNKGASEVRAADPDGCTLLFQHEAILASYLTGRVDFSWDAFKPVAMTNVEPAIFAASPNAPFDDLDGLFSYTRDHPGEVLAAASMGSNTHFILLQLQNELGVTFNIIGYEGGRERVTALLSDTVQLGQVGESDAKQYFPDQLKALAIFADTRSTTLPDVPTAIEQGHDIEIYVTRGVLLPAGAPDEVAALYEERIAKSLEDPAAIEALIRMGNAVRFRDGATYAAWWADQAQQWEQVARDIGIYMVQ
ncbi:MAG: Bug family tripartite tricarboxylate transporter substrate binding protein [Tropicimonas sp.]|uniref:Bug family tripartite tricarboxylate transporter substrate binding protein n=1 Tax=Tropicimonas sp. TaxID=2067044 RepID=UPI003A872D43